jgi:hypothetical protein
MSDNAKIAKFSLPGFFQTLSDSFFRGKAQTFFPYLAINTIIYRERRTSTKESSGRNLMQRPDFLA